MIVCRRAITLPIWSHHAPGFCMCYMYWGCTGYHNNHSTMSTEQRFKGSFYMLPPDGLDSALQEIKWGSTRSSADVGNLDILTETLRLKTCADADEQLFNRLVHKPNHVLHRLLPPPTTASQWYNLRSRRHTLQLLEHHTSLLYSNILVRMLYKDRY